VDTLGGYVYAKLGRVPARGDEIASDGARLIVDEIEGNRINKVRIVKRTPDETATNHEVARRHSEEG
jgi:CBS domain containing-hemolysin-like protein